MSQSVDSEWIDIARAGTFKSGNGIHTTFSASTFDKLINGFDERTRRIPLVFGHPSTNAPAYGWVSALRRSGNVLQAKFKQVHEDVKQLVKNGNFKNVSISISPDLSFLSHVGLLGAAQPAISGLREVTFADNTGYLVFEFSPEDMREEINRLRAEIEELARTLEATLKDKDVISKKLTEASDQQTEFNYNSKLERLKATVNAGKVSPAEFSMIEPFARALLDSAPMLTFSDSPEPVHAVDALIKILEARPVDERFLNFADLVHPSLKKKNNAFYESGSAFGEPFDIDGPDPAYLI